MSIQETALYGDLVVALRDYAAEQLAASSPTLDAEAAGAKLDEFIRTWFFMPQAALYGSAPREVIWREQLGEGNLIPKEYAAEAYGDCDCPICQMMREEIDSAESDEAHGHFWTYCPDSCLLDRYDPEGSDERWRKELEEMQEWQEERKAEREQAKEPAPGYTPAPLPGREVDPATFLSVLQRPWLDPALHRAAQQLIERCDIPLIPANGKNGPPYRRITLPEALSLAAGLNSQGVNVDTLLVQLDAWPYQNVALDWLSEPEKNLAVIEWAMNGGAPQGREADVARYRHHRDFILALAQLMPPAARLWMSGWLEAVRCASVANGGGATPVTVR
jgi:hypothetical protein